MESRLTWSYTIFPPLVEFSERNLGQSVSKICRRNLIASGFFLLLGGRGGRRRAVAGLRVQFDDVCKK